MYFTFDPYLIVLIIFCTLSQGIFGVGLLLWGTPILLLSGKSYPEILEILLPLSIAVSILQIIPNFRRLDFKTSVKFLLVCLPFLAFGLLVILVSNLTINTFVIIALLIAGCLRTPFLQSFSDPVSKKKDFLLPILGLIHGISNLGGSLLVVWASYSTTDKLGHRTLVAFSYTLLAGSQILMLVISNNQLSVSIVNLTVCVITYLISTRFIFSRVNEEIFQSFLTILIFSMAGVIASISFIQ